MEPGANQGYTRDGAAGTQTALRVVGLGEMVISSSPLDILVTYSLGSCVGLTLYDPVVRVGGMLHSIVPLSNASPEADPAQPCRYTDLAVPLLIQEALRRGVKKSRLVVKVAGASNILDPRRVFDIGRRNYTVARKILWKNDIMIAAEHVGGTVPRTMYLHVGTGRTVIRMQEEALEL